MAVRGETAVDDCSPGGSLISQPQCESCAQMRERIWALEHYAFALRNALRSIIDTEPGGRAQEIAEKALYNE